MVKDEKILFVKTKFDDYCYVVGGGIKLWESSETATLREYAEENDEGEKLVWIPIADIENQDIKPNFIKSRIHEILESKSIIHVIEESDK